MDRTLIIELSVGIVASVLVAAVGNLYMKVDANTIGRLTNKDHIATNKTTFEAALAAQTAAGDAEIKRSTAIDNEQKEKIKDNAIELNHQEDEIHDIDKDVGELGVALKFLHGATEIDFGNHREEKEKGKDK
jgi:hypothetical protein